MALGQTRKNRFGKEKFFPLKSGLKSFLVKRKASNLEKKANSKTGLRKTFYLIN
jgi:hypothetical protein